MSKIIAGGAASSPNDSPLWATLKTYARGQIQQRPPIPRVRQTSKAARESPAFATWCASPAVLKCQDCRFGENNTGFVTTLEAYHP